MGVYILDPKKCKWIVKGGYREAIEFQKSVLQLWDHASSRPMITIFLVNLICIFFKYFFINMQLENDPEIASAILPSFLSC